MIIRVLLLICVAIACIHAQWVPGGEEGTTPEPGSLPGTYIMTAPKVVRPNRPYAVSLLITESRDEQHLVRIEIRNNQNETKAFFVASDVKTGVPTTITIPKIDASKLVPGEYSLYVKGETLSQKILFEKSERLTFDQKAQSTFIQTDKAIYKPGGTIKMRAIMVDPDLKPIKGRVHMKVYDPKQNLIAQWTNQTLVMGVLTKELDLSPEPPLGSWQIKVQNADGSGGADKSFDVDKYVLPKFEVIVEPPSYVTFDQKDISVIVRAKYTYGKGVGGKVTLSVEDMYGRYNYPRPIVEFSLDDGSGIMPPQKRGILKTQQLDEGESVFRLTSAELRSAGLINKNNNEAQMRLVASVTEGLTGIVRNGTATLTAHKYDTKIAVEKSTDSMKPGLDYNLIVKVTQPDGTPLLRSKPRKVQLTTDYSWAWNAETSESKKEKDVKVITLGADGTKTVTITPPTGVQSASVQAKYDRSGEGQWEEIDYQTGQMTSTHIEAAKSPTDSYLRLVAPDTDAKPGETLKFEVSSTEELQTDLVVTVMSRGVMLLTTKQKLTNMKATVTIKVTPEMAPKSRLVVYGMRGDNKEILVDAVDFNVEGLMQNDVSIKLSRKSAEPGDKVTVTVNADGGSFIGLLGVDQSVKLLKTGNDITPSDVAADISLYNSQTGGDHYPSPWMGPIGRRRKRSSWYPYWISGKDAKQLFNNAGLIVVTDAWLFSEPPPPIYYRGGAVADGMPMPMAAPQPNGAPASATSGGQSTAATPTVRTKFPETWLWTEQRTNANGKMTYETEMPDTITTWEVTAFALNDNKGLGVVDEAAEIRVFRSFFISMNLPYSVKRGEQVALQVLAFNYEGKPQMVTFELAHNTSSGFDFVTKEGAVDTVMAENYNKRQIEVPAGAGRTIFFPIMPKKIGELMLDVTAIATTASDRVRRPLRVEPEGYRVDRNVPIMVDLSEAKTMSQTVQLNFPEDAVVGSQVATINVAGDIMGPVVANLDSLVQMPYGCGEQNMVNFVPNIVVMNYMTATDRPEQALMNKATKFMERGYQRELTYRRADNSFSAFGDSDEHGSTWLTAFVVRSFKQAQKHIFVDQKVIDTAIEYLRRQKKESGEFGETGEVHHKDMQGGASEGGVPMTAYVTLTLLENDVPAKEPVAYLEKSLSKVANEPYALAVTAYALALAKSPKAEEAWQKLYSLVQTSEGAEHWSDTVGDEVETEEDRWSYNSPKPVDVEMTAYALLTRVERGEIVEGLPIVRWLISKRTASGGWSSTQDTVLALQALAKYAEAAYDPTFDVTVDMKNGAHSHTFQVTPANALVYQQYIVRDTRSPIEITARGSGIVFATVGYHWHMTKVRRDVPFQCNQDVIQPIRDGPELVVSMCCHYKKAGKSNMAVMEVNALSGFNIDEEKLSDLTSIRHLQRVEVENDNSKANIYFNELTSDPVCLNVSSQMSYQVSDQKDATMVLYDYYEPKERIEMTYSARAKRSLQQVCADCWDNGVRHSSSSGALGAFNNKGD